MPGAQRVTAPKEEDGTPAAPEATTAERGAFDRWLLVLANLLVANAASLHVGPGGLRTPSGAVNLWITALVLIAPLLRSTLRRRVSGRLRLPGKSPVENLWFVVVLVALGAVVFYPVTLWAILIPALAVLFVLAGLRWVSPFPSFWLWVLAAVIVVLFLDALRPSPRLARPLRVVRAVAWVPPCGLFALVLSAEAQTLQDLDAVRADLNSRADFAEHA